MVVKLLICLGCVFGRQKEGVTGERVTGLQGDGTENTSGKRT